LPLEIGRWIDRMHPFKHGGDYKAFAKEISCREEEVIDLSSNINFTLPKIDIDFNTLNISPYPSYDTLYSAIASRYGVDIDSIELFNGASSGIFALFSYLDLDRCSIYSPAYLEYKKSALVYGYDVELIDRFKDIDRVVARDSLVVFVNPSTPDGKYYEIEALLEKWRDRGCTVLLDESFLDFTPFHSATEYLSKYNNLYIIKSMTKFYGSAGIRVGLLLSQPQNIIEIKSREPLWKISEFDSAYIQSALKDSSFQSRSIELNRIYKEKTIEILSNSPLIKEIYHSDSNFVLVKLEGIRANEFQERLKKYKIMVRDCSNFDGLDESFVRIAIKDSIAIDILVEALANNGVLLR
jgi:threonine-phosphate decarboxylase